MDCGRSIQRRLQGADHRAAGFQRSALFAIDEDPATIKERVRETIEAE